MAKPKRILVPKIVSATINVKRQKVTWMRQHKQGTKAFVEHGSKLAKRSMRGTAHKRYMAGREIAHSSSHFIKNCSSKTRAILDLLAKNGVKTEKPIQDLGNGTALFEHVGFTLDSKQGIRLFSRAPKSSRKKLWKAVSTMHSLGITHNHLHGGNIAITKSGEIVLIDFGLARIATKNRKPSPNAKALALDMYTVTRWLNRLEKYTGKKRSSDERHAKLIREINEAYPLELRNLRRNGLVQLLAEKEAEKAAGKK